MTLGSIPPFSTSFPYGPRPSSGVASTKFVDLFNAQTVVGLKTWTVPHVDGSAENLATWCLDEDITSMLQLVNASGTNLSFAPRLMATVSGSAAAFTLTGAKTTDSGSTNACIILQGQTAAGAAVTVSDLVAIRNLSTAVLRVTAAGGVLLNGGTSPSLTVGGPTSASTYWGTGIGSGTIINTASVPASGEANFVAQVVDGTRHRKIKLFADDTNNAVGIKFTYSSSSVPFVIISNSTEAMRVSGTGNAEIGINKTPTAGVQLDVNGPIGFKSYTVATLPVATTQAGMGVYVSDAAVAPCLAFSNGTNWKRCDNAATTVV